MMAAIQDRGPFKQGGNGSVFAKAARIQASIKPGARSAPHPASNPLLNPNQPLSGKALDQAATSLTNAQISGPLAEIAKALAAQDNQTRGTMKLAGSTFNQLGQQAQQGVTDQQQNATSLNNALQQIAGNTNSQLQGIGQNATQSLLSHSPQGDGGLAAPALAGLAADIAKQQGIAAQQQGNQQAFGANQGGNYTGLAASQLGTNAVAGTDALKSIAQSGQVKDQPFTQKIADLQAQRGALQATNLGKLRQQEINNRITETGLGIKQDAITAENTRSTNSINAANQRNRNTITGQNTRSQNTITAQNQRSQDTITAADRRDQLDRQSREGIAAANRAAKTGTGGSKPLTPHENNAVLGSLDKVQNAITTWQQDGFKDKTGKVINAHPTNAQMRQVLGSSYPTYLVQAAFELLGWGHITGGTAAALHQRGIRGGTFRGRPIAVGPPPQGLGGIGVGGVAGALGGVGSAIGGA